MNDFFEIIGGSPMQGVYTVSGSKNAALPILCATLLTSETVSIVHIPAITDTKNLIQILYHYGVSISFDHEEPILSIEELEKKFSTPYTTIHFRSPESLKILEENVQKIFSSFRASILLAGSLLTRYGSADISKPGGCAIGQRPCDLHIATFKQMGAEVIEETASSLKLEVKSRLKGSTIVFPFKSVGATENAILAASLAQGETCIQNAACEPEIVDLCACLIQMGAKIEGHGSSTIYIQGVDSLCGTTYSIMYDRIEAGTAMILCAATKGELLLKNCCLSFLTALTEILSLLNVVFTPISDGVQISAHNIVPIDQITVTTGPYPYFPTDLHPPLASLLTLYAYKANIVETIFNQRFAYIQEMQKMNANIHLQDDSCVINKANHLYGHKVQATDLRAAMALVIAAATAQGVSEIHQIHFLDRGYENFEHKLTQCQLKIRRKQSYAIL